MFLRIYIPKQGTSRLAGIGTLDSPGCQRVYKPVSRLFCINPVTKKVKDCTNISHGDVNFQQGYEISFLEKENH